MEEFDVAHELECKLRILGWRKAPINERRLAPCGLDLQSQLSRKRSATRGSCH